MFETSLRRRPQVIIPAFIAIVVGALALAGSSLGAPVPSRQMTFIDRDSGLAFVLEVEAGARDAGAFVFRVPGLGLYEGRAGASMRVLSPTSVVVNYEGPATLGPQVTFDASAPTATSRPAAIRLQAQVDPAHRTAEATLADGAQRYHLIARNADKAALTRTLKSFEDATLKADWATLYGLMNSDVRSAYTAASFAAQGSDQLATVGRIVALKRLALSDVQADDNGAMFVTATYSADTRAPSGAVTTTVYDVYFIPEQSAWRMWFTSAR